MRVGIVLKTDEDVDKFIKDNKITGAAVENMRQLLRTQSDQQRQTGEIFSKLGFDVVEVSDSALPGRIDVPEVLPYGFRDAINRFLAGLGAAVEVGSLEEIIKLNREDLANRAPYGQAYLKQSQNSSLSDVAYLALKEQHRSAARAALSNLFADYDIDVLLSDAGQAYAPAGFPAMTAPAGYDETGQPTGIRMIADYLGEPKLIAVGYAFEQATKARKAPDLDVTIKQIETLWKDGRNAMATVTQPKPEETKPKYVADLEAAYGAPSQAGFGSAVFHEQLKATDKLEEAALAKYKYFVGGLWERYGADAWMGPWKEVYVRPASAKPDIVAELRGIKDADAQLSAPMILDDIEGADKARTALAAAYDDPAVTELRAFNLGDGGAMSGLLVAGRRGDSGEAAFLVFLMD